MEGGWSFSCLYIGIVEFWWNDSIDVVPFFSFTFQVFFRIELG